MTNRTSIASIVAAALVVLTLSSSNAQETTSRKTLRIKAFDCATFPCEVMVYDANGQPIGKKQVPAIGPNGLEGESHGPSLVRILLEGREAYVSRMDIRLDKGLVASNPGIVPCRRQTGTMGSGC